MMISSTTLKLTAAVVTSFAIGISLGSSFSVSSAKAASTAFAVTGKLTIPGYPEDFAERLEDKETGTVCYLFPGIGVSCVKK